MATTTIRIDHDNQTVTFPETEVSDELVVQLFDDTSAADREELKLQAGAFLDRRFELSELLLQGFQVGGCR